MLQAQTGDLFKVRLDQLIPTQPAIGYDQVYYKLGLYRADPESKFDDYCEDNGQRGVKRYDAQRSRLDTPASFSCKQAEPRAGDAAANDLKTVVIGPAGKIYLTDGHHTTSILRALADGGPAMTLLVRVTDNFSQLTLADFWARMAAENKVWLKDQDLKNIQPSQLPLQIGLDYLQNDPYRSLVYFTRGIGYQPPAGATEFLEFYWGSWLRSSALPDLSHYDLNDVQAYATAVDDAAHKMVALRNDEEVWNGKTAESLGKLARFDQKKNFKKLTRAGSANKASGKLVYAVEYKRSLQKGCTANCR